jgi:autotransporter translocation and assembly factor TamB
VSGSQIVLSACLVVLGLGIAAALGYALGVTVGQRNEARRILRYVDGPEVKTAVRDALLGAEGLNS